MSTNRGIFESFPSQSANRPDSPFAVVQDEAAAEKPATSPFAAAARQESPFTVVDESAEAKGGDFGRPVKLPERRKMDSPFQMAEPTEGFGFEAPAAPVTSPFDVAPASPAPSPFAPAQPAPPAAPAPTPSSPFGVAEPARPVSASPSTQAAIAAFSQWHETPPPAVPASSPFATAEPVTAPAPAEPSAAPAAAVPSAFAQPVQAPPQAAVPVPPAQPAPAPPTPAAEIPDEVQSDSKNIRQLELRAIFGVDREMNSEEILQRSRALPGMRNIARVGVSDMKTVEALKALVPNLGFGSGNLKLYVGSVPVEFIREGAVMLAVQTDGGFAPGVRETLMIVARELNRLG